MICAQFKGTTNYLHARLIVNYLFDFHDEPCVPFASHRILTVEYHAAGRYGDSPGLASSDCSGACLPQAGNYCPVGQKSSGGTACVVGFYCASGADMAPCPVGTYGSAPGLALNSCSGPCAAAPGNYCPAGSTTAAGVSCSAGYFCLGASADKAPCASGRYGNAIGLPSSACSGICAAAPGSYCPPASSSAQGVGCPTGSYCIGLAAPAAFCPAGSYGGVMGLPNAQCSGACAAGSFGIAGGLLTPTCSGPCSPGFTCASGSTSPNGTGTLCPRRYYCPSGSSAGIPCPGECAARQCHKNT
jgi:hypothetical protein